MGGFKSGKLGSKSDVKFGGRRDTALHGFHSHACSRWMFPIMLRSGENARQIILASDADRLTYMALLREYA